MNPVRIVYEDAPATIPVPPDMRPRRVEAIFWPLDEPAALHANHDANHEPTKAADVDKATKPTDMTTPSVTPDLPDLAEFRATLPMQAVSAGDFCRGDARAGSLLMLIACVILRLDERLVKAGQQLGIAAVCLRSETSTDNDG